MYVAEIRDLENKALAKDIYKSIDTFNMAKDIFFIYESTFKNGFTVNKDVIAHMHILNLNNLEKIKDDEETIEDLILDYIELDREIIVKPYTGEDENFKKLLEDIIEEFGLKYRLFEPYNFDREIRLDELAFEDYNIALEIFENSNYKKLPFNSRRMLIHLVIDENGIVWCEKDKVLDLNEEPFYNIKFYRNKDIDKKLEAEITREEGIFNTDWHEPITFLTEEGNVSEKIVDYKYKVFNKIKNIKPRDYPETNPTLIELLNNLGYIQMDDVVDILRGENIDI